MMTEAKPILNKLLLTDKELAAELGISRPTLWRWRNSVPDFPQPIRIGPRAVRYRLGDIRTYIDSRQGV